MAAPEGKAPEVATKRPPPIVADSHDAWKDAWETGRTGWHIEDVNPYLSRHARLLIPEDGPSQTVLIPLCGRSRDVAWLASLDERKHKVVGVELHEGAAQGIFKDAGLEWERSDGAGFVKFQGKGSGADNMTVYCGDFFAEALHTEIGKVSCVYDRGCTVALTPELRKKFGAAIRSMASRAAVHLIVSFDYDQEKKAGPPHSVPMEELLGTYGDVATVKELERSENEKFTKIVGASAMEFAALVSFHA